MRGSTLFIRLPESPEISGSLHLTVTVSAGPDWGRSEMVFNRSRGKRFQHGKLPALLSGSGKLSTLLVNAYDYGAA